MNPNLHPALVEAYAVAPADIAHIYTLELRHVSMSSPLLLVQGYINREIKTESMGTAQTFRACAFNFTLPSTDEAGLRELTLTMDNTDNRVSDFCESSMNFPNEPVEIYYRAYLSNDLNTPMTVPPLRLYLTNVEVTETQVSGRASGPDYLNLKFPTENYTSPRFPSPA